MIRVANTRTAPGYLTRFHSVLQAGIRPTHWSNGGTVLDSYDAYLSAVYKLADASDSKGSNTLTESGSPSYSAGKSGNGVSLNGSSQSLYRSSCAATQFGSSSFTFSAWIKPSGSTFYGAILSTYGGTSPTFILRMTTSNDVELYYDGGSYGGGGLTYGQWYHVAVTRDAANGNRGDLYLNGTSIRNWTDAYNYSTANTMRIGWSHSTCYFSGMIDEVNIWNGAALPSSAVATLADDAFYVP